MTVTVTLSQLPLSALAGCMAAAAIAAGRFKKTIMTPPVLQKKALGVILRGKKTLAA